LFVKRTPSLGSKRALRKDQLGRLAEIPERQRHHSLLIVRIRILPTERVGDPGGRIDFEELSREKEQLVIGGLHRDPVAAPALHM
jgi:hypothetical protein